MTKKDSADRNDSPELAAFRREIDKIDEHIVKLLIDRTGVVSRVGELKRSTAPGRCPIRSGREADMVRAIVRKFDKSPFLPAAAAAIWRFIIGMSLSVEAPMTLSVFISERDHDLYWMAREYFGPFSPIVKQAHIKRVLGDVMDGKAAIGVVPMLRSSDTTYWWTNLMQQGSDVPKVFARIPFINTDTPGRDAPSALAIARVTPEASDDDNTLMVIEADHNVSQNKLQTAFSAVKLSAIWINIATISSTTRHHLIEIRGFVTNEHPAVQSLISSLGQSILNVSFIGSYAVPMVLAGKISSHDPKAVRHGAGSE